jgi:hypothetical protein
MVYMSGNKFARNAASITNRPTCGGSAKKSGLAPRVGWYLTNNVNLRGAPQTMSMVCKVNRTVQTQKYGYSATHGGNMG